MLTADAGFSLGIQLERESGSNFRPSSQTLDPVALRRQFSQASPSEHVSSTQLPTGKSPGRGRPLLGLCSLPEYLRMRHYLAHWLRDPSPSFVAQVVTEQGS
jgi:hypothetical protein